jgi:hypothetical protein
LGGQGRRERSRRPFFEREEANARITNQNVALIMQVIDFLGHLLRHLSGKPLVGWYGLSQHRTHLASAFEPAKILREEFSTLARSIDRESDRLSL